MDMTNVDDRLLHGIVLAGGEGKRLQLYVQEIRGEALPKQYVNLIGGRSMLEHTFDRAEQLIPARQILTAVTRRHLLRADVCRQLASRFRETLIVQPANKDTGPGILLPLVFIYKRCPDAIVAIFPSDHLVLEENRFMNHVKLAVQAVQYHPSRMVLLAIEPDEPETDYGYVVPHNGLGEFCRFGTRGISTFAEKPRTDLATKLVTAGGLWNTMVMVFKADTLLQLVRGIHPLIYPDFWRIFEALGTREERATIERVYEKLQPVNFSKQILERIALNTQNQYQFFRYARFLERLGFPRSGVASSSENLSKPRRQLQAASSPYVGQRTIENVRRRSVPYEALRFTCT